jgi:ribosomal protein L3
MTKLWQYTEAQAEAMSAANAAKVLAEQEELETDGQNETSDRELAGYALDYDDDGKPKKDSSGNYVPLARGYDVPDAPDIWRHLSKIYSKEKMMRITVEEAESLQPKVKEILERKVKGPLEAFKKEASEETKRKYNDADDAAKGTILAAWLKSKGKSFDGGRRRKTRKGRKGGRKSRRTTRKH